MLNPSASHKTTTTAPSQQSRLWGRIANARALGLGLLVAAGVAVPAAPAIAATGTLIGGTPITTQFHGTGTAGVVVHDNNSGKPMLLTNHHVLGAWGPFEPGTPVTDPGGYTESLSRSEQSLGRWARDMYQGGPIDMAAATLDRGVEYNESIRGLGMPIGSGEPAENTTVFMYDRIGMHAVVSGKVPPGGVHPNSFEIIPDPSSGGFGHPGDSGSVIVDQNRLVVGLFTGCSAVACGATRISLVLDSAHMNARVLDPDHQSIPLFRYYDENRDQHFYTTRWQELGDAEASPGWHFEGTTGAVMKNPTCVQGTCATRLYRYVSACGNGHFYSADYNELGAGSSCWRLEGTEGYVFRSRVAGTVPVYRFNSTVASDHFYTLNPGEVAGNRAWKFEGIGFYVYPTFGMSS